MDHMNYPNTQAGSVDQESGSTLGKSVYCTECGAELQGAMKFCAACGTSAGVATASAKLPLRLARSRSAKAANASAEREFLRTTRVRVTNSRIIVDSHTFSTANVTSVRAMVDDKNVAGGWFLLISCLLVAVVCFSSELAVGGVFFIILACVGLVMAQSRKFWVMLSTAGAEHKAYEAASLDDAQEIVEAISRAIIDRG